MPSVATITSGINYALAFLAVLLAGLQGFDWLAFFDAETALKIVACLNLLGLTVKAWIATAEQMAQRMKGGS
ncbi:hypothetical protein [Sinorhizobium fredii]|uniref:hypothetical protein n=1 Tax=Rhizobium fredii TaxID=380 RepID=UPI0004AFDF61|nr:hypothetical protein [Sinorhizobium fredii]ASY68913.1 hypothetical protein SF83666_c14920 [Sinorhizobium fredii CCBAU 83666]